MNSQFQEKKGTFFLLLGLIFLLLIVIYFMFFQPLMKESKAKENELSQLESDIQVLKAKIENADKHKVEGEDIESIKLAKRLPLDPETEKLILTLEAIESISNSRFDNITFSYNGSVPERAAENDEENGGEQESNQEGEEIESNPEDEENAEEEAGEPQEPVIDLQDKPENLQVIQISMDVTSPDYDHFQIFIQEIEKQERMMFVGSLDFQKPAEQELIINEEPTEIIVANVNIVTFFYDQEL